MSFCCKLGPDEHEDTCANNPKNFGSAPDATEPKAVAERKMIDPEKLRRMNEELRSVQADYFVRSKKP
jgi:hypothetical protein